MMKLTQTFTDKLAIGISLACAAHCLLLPLAVLMLPSLTALGLENEAFHFWMVVAVLPSSLYALTLGCRNHGRYRILGAGMVGLSLLILALVLGESRIGEMGEKGLTLLGASIIAVAHWFNFQRCQKSGQEGCHGEHGVV